MGPEDVKQVWFAGVHCDVGGGYPEKESGLAKLALEWMLEEAKATDSWSTPLANPRSCRGPPAVKLRARTRTGSCTSR